MDEPRYMVLHRIPGTTEQTTIEFDGSMAGAIDHIKQHLARFPFTRDRLVLVSVVSFDAAIDVRVDLTFADGIHL